MRHSAKPMVISFAFVSLVASLAPAIASSIARSPQSDARIELASAGNQRCRTAETSRGPRRRCRDGGVGGNVSDRSQGEWGEHGDSERRSGWGGVYGGWNAGYGSRFGD